MVEVLIAGEMDPAAIAELTRGRLRNKHGQLEQALAD